MDTTVTSILIDESVCFDSVKRYVRHVSPQRQERIGRYVLEKDQLTSLTAGLLARREASRSLGVYLHELSFACGESGKPYLPEYPKYHFSLSHSGRYVALACGGTPVGVDVELVSDPDLIIAEACFAPGELNYLLQSGSRQTAFYEVWTQKEAYVKMLGTGMSTPFLSFDVTDNDMKKMFRSQRRAGYWLSVCSRALEDSDGRAHFQQLTLQELLDSFC